VNKEPPVAPVLNRPPVVPLLPNKPLPVLAKGLVPGTVLLAPKRLVYPNTLAVLEVVEAPPNLKLELNRADEAPVVTPPKRVPPVVGPVERLPNNPAPGLVGVADFSPLVTWPSDLSSLTYSVLVTDFPKALLNYSFPVDELS
jgi:hypothetical protein